MLRPKVFQGGYGPEAYLSWTAHMDSCIWHHRMPEHERLPLVIKQLRGEAASWWNLEEEERWYYKEPPINTWEELKLFMDERYIPSDFPEDIKERYGRRPIRKRAPKVQQEHPTHAHVHHKPCEQVLRTKLFEGGGYDEDIKSNPIQEEKKVILEEYIQEHTKVCSNKSCIDSFDEEDVRTKIEEHKPNHGELSQDPHFSIFLTHQGSTKKQETAHNGSNLTRTEISNRVVQNCPNSAISLFGSLQTYLWRPGDFSYDLKAPNSVLRCTIKHEINWTSPHLDFPYSALNQAINVAWIYLLDLFDQPDLETFHTIKTTPKDQNVTTSCQSCLDTKNSHIFLIWPKIEH